MSENLPKRKTLRLDGYDYSQNGAYFITICVKDKQNLLWQNNGIEKYNPQLSKCGNIVETAINQIPKYYSDVAVDKYVIMPNHLHMILVSNTTQKISVVVQQLKRHISKQVEFPVWQRSYHDHIIRDMNDYKAIWQYIDENPVRWKEDCYFG